jgi:uncharacterized protein (TIGR03435 family)
MTMASLARYLSVRLGGPVQDLTAIKGTYDIDLSWVPDPALEKIESLGEHNAETRPGSASAAADLRLPDTPVGDIFTSIRASLGLRLEARKEQVEVIVIDHIERVPVEN